MNENWNIRLKECREKSKISLKELGSFDRLGMSQQSLIKYEKGEVYPRIDLLEKMCKEYGTTVDYILYGDANIANVENRSDSLTTLFMLLYAGKVTFDETAKSIYVADNKLLRQIRALEQFRKKGDISSIDGLVSLIKGIKNLEDI